jgi:5'(3')-deoxyribonucleotidase
VRYNRQVKLEKERILDIRIDSIPVKITAFFMLAVRVREAVSDSSASGTEKPTVALDNDGTLANVLPVIIARVNERKGTRYTVQDYKKWNPAGASIGLSENEFHEVYVDVWKNHWREILPLTDSGRMERLANATNLYVLSGMDETLVPYFKKWLRHNFPEVADKLTICTVESMKAKLSEGFHVLIDDVSDPYMRGLGHRLHLMPQQPYNIDVPIGPKTMRISTTSQAIDALLKHLERTEEHDKNVEEQAAAPA